MRTAFWSSLCLAGALLATTTGVVHPAEPPALPLVTGEIEPRVVPLKGEDGLYHQAWFVQSFLDRKSVV